MNTYKKSGVDINKGNELVGKIKNKVKSTFTDGVINPLGGFASLFELDRNKYKNPILVSSTDGVGTKLRLAFMSNRHNTIGIDLVAMCVNDVLVYGAKPLFFLDYYAVGTLNVNIADSVISGIVEGCKQADCALVGGETAEMPSFYQENEYDCAGFVVGVVDKEKVIDGKNMKDGDVVLAISSSGVHSNGFSLVRKIFFTENSFNINHVFPELNKPLIDVLLEPTIIYVKPILNILDSNINVKAMCHITGGGLIENLPRVIPNGFRPVIELSKLNINPIFSLMSNLGNICIHEMLKVFNMGVGFVVIVAQEDLSKTQKILEEYKLSSNVIGHIEKSNNSDVIFTDINTFRI